MSRHPLIRVPIFIFTSMLVLPLGCAIALAWANTEPESYFRLSHALEFPINSIGLVFFFGLMAKPVVEATLTGGALHPWRRAAMPVAAALGGLIVPPLLYYGFLYAVDEPMLMQFWPVTMAADIAACYLVGTLIFGKRAALPFLLLLAMTMDTLGLCVVATFTPTSAFHLTMGLAIVGLGILSAFALRYRRVQSMWPYLLVSGTVCWCGLWLADVPPALALLPVVPLMPHRKHDPGLFAEPTAHDRDTLSRFERAFAPPVQVVLLLFGLVNGGIALHGLEAGIWALPLALAVGRPIGVLIGAELGRFGGLHRPADVGWRDFVVIGSAASIGLTMALFFAAAMLPIGTLREQLRTGALMTWPGFATTLVLALLLRVGRFQKAAGGSEP